MYITAPTVMRPQKYRPECGNNRLRNSSDKIDVLKSEELGEIHPGTIQNNLGTISSSL